MRDDNLVGILRALKHSGSGAGGVVKAHEAALSQAGMPLTLDRQIPQGWTDYNGHMNETYYLEAGSKATDRFMEMVGADETYVAEGLSYFTVENHVIYLEEAHAGDRLTAATRLLNGQGKKLHLFHTLARGDGVVVATVESFLLHVDLKTRKSCLPSEAVQRALSEVAEVQASLPVPEGAGRVGR